MGQLDVVQAADERGGACRCRGIEAHRCCRHRICRHDIFAGDQHARFERPQALDPWAFPRFGSLDAVHQAEVQRTRAVQVGDDLRHALSGNFIAGTVKARTIRILRAGPVELQGHQPEQVLHRVRDARNPVALHLGDRYKRVDLFQDVVEGKLVVELASVGDRRFGEIGIGVLGVQVDQRRAQRLRHGVVPPDRVGRPIINRFDDVQFLRARIEHELAQRSDDLRMRDEGFSTGKPPDLAIPIRAAGQIDLDCHARAGADDVTQTAQAVEHITQAVVKRLRIVGLLAGDGNLGLAHTRRRHRNRRRRSNLRHRGWDCISFRPRGWWFQSTPGKHSTRRNTGNPQKLAAGQRFARDFL